MLDLPAGFRDGGGGLLRRSVEVQHSADGWVLRHSLWELQLPAAAYPEAVGNLLGRRLAIGSLDLQQPALRNIVKLLVAQGCVTYDGTRTAYGRDEILYIVGAQIATWYARYYGHPFWAKLSATELSLSQVFAWMLRTYHLSRSAGVTAARGAVCSPSPEVRAAFLRNALEEYEHCEAYYFPLHARFGVDSAAIKSMLPSPSSTAFDDQMAVIAEDDWLAHAIVAYFQEYTATFRESAFQLYDRLEAAYGLNGFFHPWKVHVGYDIDQTHADHFAAVIGSAAVDAAHLRRSLDNAACTVQYLIGALDELLALAPDTDLQRFRRDDSLPGVLEAGSSGPADPFALATRLVTGWGARLAGRTASGTTTLATAMTQGAVADLATRALAHATKHDDVCLFGRMLEAADRPADDRAAPSGAQHRAIINFLRERSARPQDFAVLTCVVAAALTANSESAKPWALAIRDAARRWGATAAETPDLGSTLRIGGQFLEFCNAAASLWRTDLPIDVLADPL